MRPSQPYRWNPYAKEDPQTPDSSISSRPASATPSPTQHLQGESEFAISPNRPGVIDLRVPLDISHVVTDEWVMEHQTGALPPAAPKIFVGQLFATEPKRALAVLAWCAGVKFLVEKIVPRRSLFQTGYVAVADVENLVRLHKKAKCMLLDDGMKIIRMVLMPEDIIALPHLDILVQSCAGAQLGVVHKQSPRRIRGVPNSPMVIELAEGHTVSPMHTRSRTPSPLSSSSSSADRSCYPTAPSALLPPPATAFQ